MTVIQGLGLHHRSVPIAWENATQTPSRSRETPCNSPNHSLAAAREGKSWPGRPTFVRSHTLVGMLYFGNQATIWVKSQSIVNDRRKKLFPNLRRFVGDYDLKVSEGRVARNVLSE